MNIAIFGAGSIGCYLGGQLASAGANVTFIGRQKFKAALDKEGLMLTHFERETLHVPPADFTFSLSPEDIATADIILLTVKSQDTAEATQAMKAYAKAEAIVISFQNGVSNPDVLRDILTTQTVLGGVVPFNVTGTGAGQFHCGTEGALSVESHASALLEPLKTYFKDAGQALNFEDNIESIQWGKLLVNLNNAFNTLSGGTLLEGLMQRDYRRALALMIEEALGVVRGAGIEPAAFGKSSPEKMIKVLRLPNFIYAMIMNKIVKIDAAARSSMLDDLEMGRVPEIDYLQGEIVRLAKKTGQTAPYNQAVLEIVKTAFEAGVSPKMNGKQIYQHLRTDI